MEKIQSGSKIKRSGVCIACKSKLEDPPLMELNRMPASAQDIPDREEAAFDEGVTLHLCECPVCGLVQMDCEPVAYYKDVIRAGGFTVTMLELRRRQYRRFIETYGLEGKKFIEIGCGGGEFLEVLTEFPVQAYGVEHKKELVETAREKGLCVWQGFTETEDTALESGEAKGPYDAFLSFNYLEHQPDPVTMLKCAANNLTGDGMGLITAPSLEYILQYDGYYELIRDHLACYTMDTLRFVLEEAGFEVLEEEIFNRDTISAVVKKSRHPGIRHREKPEKADVSGLEKSRIAIQKELDALIDGLEKNGEKLALWGAGHQGFTLASTTRLEGRVSYIIDSAPFKQGRFAPASHLPIVSPEHYFEDPVDVILIVAPTYSEEIAKNVREKYGKRVRTLTLRGSHIEELA